MDQASLVTLKVFTGDSKLCSLATLNMILIVFWKRGDWEGLGGFRLDKWKLRPRDPTQNLHRLGSNWRSGEELGLRGEWVDASPPEAFSIMTDTHEGRLHKDFSAISSAPATPHGGLNTPCFGVLIKQRWLVFC